MWQRWLASTLPSRSHKFLSCVPGGQPSWHARLSETENHINMGETLQRREERRKVSSTANCVVDLWHAVKSMLNLFPRIYLATKVSSTADCVVDLWGRNSCWQRMARHSELHTLAGVLSQKIWLFWVKFLVFSGVSWQVFIRHMIFFSCLKSFFFSGVSWLLLPLPQPGSLPLTNRFILSIFHLLNNSSSQYFIF